MSRISCRRLSTPKPSIVITPPPEDSPNDPHPPPVLDADAVAWLAELESNVLDVRDSLLTAKIAQAHHANSGRAPDPDFKVGDRVMLATAHRRRDYMQAKDGRVAKFMPRFDGPYEVLKAFPHSSIYTLRLPPGAKNHPTFHASQLRAFVPNDDEMFPSRKLAQPGPIVTENGTTEYFIDRTIDERRWGRGRQYLVRWTGYGPEADLWLPRSSLLDTEALDNWEQALPSE